ncbi:dihydrolipoyl dehydrogenase [Candidatus Contendibacter odensensis]|uniref:Dihydrolipoyl dehydrogenase n=1 Tax=Candidatus Contendobacter odensis Run_B_J11 TaxID=1400861 RepID=A0A7U7J3F4_9GAMM|nr:dihydrolipoyl dehydrogenase [Candidatus Contendobacter odensis]CDH45164.1 lipoamide dehydrogenase, E3 component is part of three enzyme complexes [Candidatus Contendobacter odensis Run_B_J11]
MAKTYDVVVIGGGPAGYVAAIRCAQLGLETACVEKWINFKGDPALGGTCLNVGCIPSKTLLESSEQYHHIKDGIANHGIHVEGVRLDLDQMMARKEDIVLQLTNGISALFKANGVEWLQGHGKLLANRQVEITGHDGVVDVVSADNVIIATGSRPIDIGAAPVDNAEGLIVDSTGALDFRQVPATLGVIGAGVIGLELGSVWSRLGSKVIVLEAVEDFLSLVDQQIARDALRQFRKQGMDIHMGARVIATRKTANGVEVHFKDKDGDHEIMVEKLLVSVGRRPNTDDVAAPESGLLFGERGYIHVDEHCATNLPGVYAVGDVVRGPMLAHKGSEEGVMVAEIIAGQPGHLNYDTIPWVIYTSPEIAWVGKTEQALKAEGIPYKIGSFPFSANGRAKAMDHANGMVKLLAHAETDTLLGCHIIGPFASELVQEAVLAMEFNASSEDLARTIHGHPTLYEAMHEAALSVHGRALHKINT